MTDTVAIPVRQPGMIGGSPPSEAMSSHGRVSAEGEIGFVGLGHMGTAMAANLAATGQRVIAYVRRPDQIDELVALGLKPTTEFTKLFDWSPPAPQPMSNAVGRYSTVSDKRHLSSAPTLAMQTSSSCSGI